VLPVEGISIQQRIVVAAKPSSVHGFSCGVTKYVLFAVGNNAVGLPE